VISERHQVENGIPQGSIISPLFSIMINDIFKEVENFVDVALFADDGGREGREGEMLIL